MRSQGAVAGFTVDMSVDAFRLTCSLVRMALLTGLVTSVMNRFCRSFRQSSSPEVAITPETLRNEHAAENEKQNQADGKHRSHAQQVGSVLKFDHGRVLKFKAGTNVRQLIYCAPAQNYRAPITPSRDVNHVSPKCQAMWLEQNRGQASLVNALD